MGHEISKIRFMCREHNVPLKVMGRDEIFYPTFCTVQEANGKSRLGARMDEEGWLILDTSELGCDKCYEALELDELVQDWYIEAE